MWEIWRDIKGFEARYQVSSRGRVRSLARVVRNGKGKHTIQGKILKAAINNAGYLVVSLRLANGKRVQKTIHRLVAETFMKNPNKLPQVNHKNENKLKNEYTNLEWCTCKYNVNYGAAQQKRKAAREENRRICA